MATLIADVTNTNYINNAEFIRIEVPNGPDGGVYTFSSSYKTETFVTTSVITTGSQYVSTGTYNTSTVTLSTATFTTSTNISGTFTALGGLVGVSGHQRDLSVTSYDTSITLIGIDQTKVGLILSSSIIDPQTGLNKLIQLKGSKIQVWRGFYNPNMTLSNVYLRYTGIVTGYNIQEERQSQIDSFTLALHCSSYKKVLENRHSGRHTNSLSWNTINGITTSSASASYDAGMDNIAALNNATFNFGQKLA
jgi:hypothetical protein